MLKVSTPPSNVLTITPRFSFLNSLNGTVRKPTITWRSKSHENLLRFYSLKNQMQIPSNYFGRYCT